MTLELVLSYLPYILAALSAVFALVGLYLNGQLDKFAREAVAAIYRVAIHVAQDLGDDGLAWLKSEEGVAFRKYLAEQAYDLLPVRVGPVPVGLVKVVITRERWCALVEDAFQQVVKVAEKLEA